MALIGVLISGALIGAPLRWTAHQRQLSAPLEQLCTLNTAEQLSFWEVRRTLTGHCAGQPAHVTFRWTPLGQYVTGELLGSVITQRGADLHLNAVQAGAFQARSAQLNRTGTVTLLGVRTPWGEAQRVTTQWNPDGVTLHARNLNLRSDPPGIHAGALHLSVITDPAQLGGLDLQVTFSLTQLQARTWQEPVIEGELNVMRSAPTLNFWHAPYTIELNARYRHQRFSSLWYSSDPGHHHAQFTASPDWQPELQQFAQTLPLPPKEPYVLSSVHRQRPERP